MTTTTLSYKTCWHAPGYRDLRLVLVDRATGKEYELHLPPQDVQKLIFEFADAAKQIGEHPPIDWDAYRAQIIWPSVTPWKIGPPAPRADEDAICDRMERALAADEPAAKVEAS